MTSTNIESRRPVSLATVLTGLRRGDFVTTERMRLVGGAVLIFTILTIGFLAATSHGSVDIMSRPLGTDFSSFYAAGKAALEGAPASSYDPQALHARQQAIFGQDTPFYAWQYPPFFLALVAPLAVLPYPLALALWQGVTLLFFVLTIRAIVRTRERPATVGTTDRLWLLLVLGFPAVFVNLGHGQNGFLSAALIGTALLQLDRRPVIAGILFGLLAYKPQLGVMIPLVLLATGRWRAFISAAATVILLVLATLAIFGPEAWRAFLASTSFTRHVLLEGGNPGWEKIQSVFAAIRLWGGSSTIAYAAQIAASLAVAAALVWMWRSKARYALKAAALVLALMLAAPFSVDYDMTVLAVAIALLAVDGLDNGFAPFEKSLLAALWLVPLVARGVAIFLHVPLGVITMGVAFVFLVRSAAIAQRTPRALPA